MKLFSVALTAAAFIFCSAMPVAARTGIFVVNLRNGESVEFKLSERPKLTFPDGKLIISTAELRSEFDLNEVMKSEFNGVSEAAGIEPVADKAGETVVFDLETFPGHVLVGGCRNASVYDMSGKLVFSGRQDDSELIDFDMTDLQPGVYVIYTPARSIKYSKR